MDRNRQRLQSCIPGTLSAIFLSKQTSKNKLDVVSKVDVELRLRLLPEVRHTNIPKQFEAFGQCENVISFA